MRLPFVVATFMVGALLGVGAQPTPVAAASPPKVAVIVGPVGGSTAGYIRDAEAAVAEALKHTSNVVRVYTPNATWAAARAAMQDASIVIYMGHGNGFPSPYTTSLAMDRQNGLGVNPTAGGDDSATKYYGEQFLRNEVRLAPNAVVILGHLCYASGTSEPGKPAPTEAQARDRVDNYAAGFLAIGARAVIAEAYGSSPAAYVQALFTTNQSVQNMWLTSPSNKGHAFAFPSTRSPGMTAQMDPESSGRYYRSWVGDPNLQTSQVTSTTGIPVTGPNAPSTPGTIPIGPPVIDPGVSPTPVAPPVTQPPPFAVPGGAMVAIDGAQLFADPTLMPDPTTLQPVATFPAGTPLRVLSDVGATADGARIYHVQTVDQTLNGYMIGTWLQAADGAAPVLLSVITPVAFSPNGDGFQDTLVFAATFNKSVAWQLTISNPRSGVVANLAATGADVSLTWDGMANGQRVPDATYTWQLVASDAFGNAPLMRSGSFSIDTTPPTLTSTSAPIAGPAVFSPNGDGVADRWIGTYNLGGPGTIDAVVAASDGSFVRRFSANATSSGATVAWDGRSDAGSGVADGQYMVALTARDAAGNISAPILVPVIVFRALGSVRVSATVFYPQDGDTLAPSTQLGFALTQNATVTWQIVAANGMVVFSQFAAAALAPAAYSMVWAGRDQAGKLVPAGRYDAVLTATNGTLTDTIRTKLTASGFAITTSVASVKRGGSVTITAVSAEPLKANPRLTMTRPGLSAQTFAMTKVAPNTYRLVLRLSSNGKVGTMTLKVSGTDTKGGTNATTATLPVK